MRIPSRLEPRAWVVMRVVPLGNAQAPMLSATSRALGKSGTEHRELLHPFCVRLESVVIDDASEDLMVDACAGDRAFEAT